MFFNILEVGHYFASPNRCSCAVFYGVVCIYTQMCGGLQTSSSSVFVAQFWLECGPNNFLLQKLPLLNKDENCCAWKKSKASQRLQAITQPQSPLQLVRNSQTPDGAIALASLLDNSKLLKKLPGRGEAITHYKKISPVRNCSETCVFIRACTGKS